MARPALDNASPLPVGTVVTIKSMMPPGHVRTPAYLRGKTGRIERSIAPFGNPEKLAYGLKAETQMLYRVRFTMADLWGDTADHPQDTVDAEVYHHWIEPGEEHHAS